MSRLYWSYSKKLVHTTSSISKRWMKITAKVRSIGMTCSSFVSNDCSLSFSWTFSQIIRDFTLEELASLRTKATKTSTVDTKYQEALRLFKTIVEHANKRRWSDSMNTAPKRALFVLQVVLNWTVVLCSNPFCLWSLVKRGPRVQSCWKSSAIYSSKTSCQCIDTSMNYVNKNGLVTLSLSLSVRHLSRSIVLLQICVFCTCNYRKLGNAIKRSTVPICGFSWRKSSYTMI